MRFQLVIAALSGVLLLLTLELIRRRRLKEEYSLLWLLTGIGLLIMSVWSDAAGFLARVFGTFYLTPFVVLSFVFLLGIVLHFSTVISRLAEQNKELAQRYALLEGRVRRTEAPRSGTPDPDPPGGHTALTREGSGP